MTSIIDNLHRRLRRIKSIDVVSHAQTEKISTKEQDVYADSDFPVSVIGYRLAEDSVKDASEIEFEAKQAKEKEKAEKKQTKEITKFDKEIKELEYERKIRQMDMDTYLKIEQRRKELKELKKSSKPTDGLTGTN
jgi:hypothetical protein